MWPFVKRKGAMNVWNVENPIEVRGNLCSDWILVVDVRSADNRGIVRYIYANLKCIFYMCRRRKLTIRTDIAVIQIIYFVGLYFTQRLISWQTKEEALQKKFLAYNSKKTVNFKATYNIHNKSAAGSLPMEHECAGPGFCCWTLPASHGFFKQLALPFVNYCCSNTMARSVVFRRDGRCML